MLHDLYAHFKQYWPEKKSKNTVADGYLPEGESGVESGEALPPPEDLEEVDDVDLARALGVPHDCVLKMTPKKEHPHEPTEQSSAEKRNLRIQELQLLDFDC